MDRQTNREHTKSTIHCQINPDLNFIVSRKAKHDKNKKDRYRYHMLHKHMQKIHFLN